VSEDPRTGLIEKAIRAFNDEDVAALISFIHPEVVSRVAEGLGTPGTWHGLEGFGSMMQEWGEAWSENTIELHEVERVGDDAALAITSQRAVGAGSGIPLEFGTVFMTVFEGDRAIRFEIHPNRESALASLGIGSHRGAQD
jgi:ketosteroid isomerase-like protein